MSQPHQFYCGNNCDTTFTLDFDPQHVTAEEAIRFCPCCAGPVKYEGAPNTPEIQHQNLLTQIAKHDIPNIVMQLKELTTFEGLTITGHITAICEQQKEQDDAIESIGQRLDRTIDKLSALNSSFNGLLKDFNGESSRNLIEQIIGEILSNETGPESPLATHIIDTVNSYIDCHIELLTKNIIKQIMENYKNSNLLQ